MNNSRHKRIKVNSQMAVRKFKITMTIIVNRNIKNLIYLPIIRTQTNKIQIKNVQSAKRDRYLILQMILKKKREFSKKISDFLTIIVTNVEMNYKKFIIQKTTTKILKKKYYLNKENSMKPLKRRLKKSFLINPLWR